MRAVLDEGLHDGVKEELLYDESEQKIAIKRTSDVTANLDANKRDLASGDGYTPSRAFQRVASIPVGVQLEWIGKYGVDPCAKGNEALLKRLLNSSEWAYLRTAPGRL